MRAFATPRTLLQAHARAHALANVDALWLLRGLLLLVAVAYIAAFVIAALFRLSYPFPLHPAEPATLTEVERVLRGLPLYVEPTLAHVPLIYGPIYSYVSAALAFAVGDGFAAPRLASLLASVGALAVIAALVHRETGSLIAGVVGAGLYAASYSFADTALDLGRVDALFTLLLLAALFAARQPSFDARGRTWWIAASGVLIGLAALTKIPLGAAPLGVALLLYLAYAHPRQVLVYVAAVLLSVGVGLLLLRAQNGAWATWFLWDLPRLHELRNNLIGRFWWSDLLPRLSIALLFGPVFVIAHLLQRDARPLVCYGAATGSLLMLSWLSRSNAGGAPNVLLPAFAIAAVLFGLGAHAALSQLIGSSARVRAFQAYVLGACLLQFGLVAYNPRLSVPFRSDQWADEALATRLTALPGPIYAPDLAGYLRGTDRANQPMNGPIDEVRGAFGGPGTAEGRAIEVDIERALDERRYRYVVVDVTDCCLASTLLAHGYVEAGPLFPPDDVFFEWKSWRTPEERLYAPAGAN